MDSVCEFIVCASPLPLPSILSFLNSPCLNSPWGRGPILGSVCSWGWCEDPKIGSVELLGCDAKLAFERGGWTAYPSSHLPIFPSSHPIFLSEIRESMRIRSPSCPTEGGRGSDRVPVSAVALRS
jgi:hypothetical protein